MPHTKKRIVHFIHLDGDGGGPYSVTKHFTFYSHFHHVHVIHGGRGRIAKTCEDLGIPHTRLETESLLDSILSLPILTLVIFNLRPDLLVLHGQWAGPVGVLAGRLALVSRILYVAHWPSFFADWDAFRMFRNRIAEWLPCRLASRVIAISRANATSYLQIFPWIAPKLLTLSNSIDDGEIASELEIASVRKKHGWENGKVNIVSVGRLVDQKRVDWLLDAWADCRDLWTEAKLWIVGDGPERAKLEEMAVAGGFGESCEFLGNQPRGLVYIAASDLVVFTSLYESFGNVTLEAMFSGKPIVASKVAGIESTLQDGIQGFLIPPGDKSALSKCLRVLIKDPELRDSMGAAGKLRAREYSTSVVLPKFLSIINNMLNRKSSNATRP